MMSIGKTEGLIVTGIFFILILSNCRKPQDHRRVIRIDQSGMNLEIRSEDILLTSLHFADTLYKPFFWPVYTLNGIPITRGYPLNPKKGEPSDHPHQTGLWFNFGNVNGLDFWNNSDAVPSDKKHLYGRIMSDSFHIADNNSRNSKIELFSAWKDHSGQTLLYEKSTFLFEVLDSTWSITRNTSLTARTSVTLQDNKEGLFAIRLAKEFQSDIGNPEYVIDSTGKSSIQRIISDEGKKGLYVGSNGTQGNDTWGTSNEWVYIKTVKDSDTLSVMIMDHPSNFGFPSIWHARNYGLFSVNNLGRISYRAELQEVHKDLVPGESLTFRHIIVIKNGGSFREDEIRRYKNYFYSGDQEL